MINDRYFIPVQGWQRLPCFVESSNLLFVVTSERTYTAPRKWMKGKGRVTIQFGCCYNYATVSLFTLH